MYILGINPEKIPNRIFPDPGESHDCYSDGFIDGKQAVLSHVKKIDILSVSIEQTAEGNNPPYIRDETGHGLLFWSTWGQILNMGKSKEGYLAFIPAEFLQSKLADTQERKNETDTN